ncbi:hypothetical protein V5T82_16585 [Magnetovibrio sp. PR-2]|uniref:hypothetical protein n=1 Tax=Magnetovibrio sp. PR-2 TaxID=3120356 RepID=UPI002FCE42DA
MPKRSPGQVKDTPTRDVVMIRLYGLNRSVQDDELAERWGHLANINAIHLDFRFVDLAEHPDLVSKLNIVCTPTAIMTFPDGGFYRCYGYGDKVDDLLLAFCIKRRAQGSVISAQDMVGHAFEMDFKAKQMSDEARKMIDKSRKRLNKIKELKGESAPVTPKY